MLFYFQEHVNPQDLAIVRFTPSKSDPHSDYADEVYLPPIKERLLSLAKQGKDDTDNDDNSSDIDKDHDDDNHVVCRLMILILVYSWSL